MAPQTESTRIVIVRPTRDGDHIIINVTFGHDDVPLPRARHVHFGPNSFDSQTPRERVRRRARNTMAGMVNSALDQRLTAAMEAMTEAEIRRLDNSTSRLGMDGTRIIELP